MCILLRKTTLDHCLNLYFILVPASYILLFYFVLGLCNLNGNYYLKRTIFYHLTFVLYLFFNTSIF